MNVSEVVAKTKLIVINQGGTSKHAIFNYHKTKLVDSKHTHLCSPISTPSPFIPEIITFDLPILRIASCPSTYLATRHTRHSNKQEIYKAKRSSIMLNTMQNAQSIVALHHVNICIL